MAINVVWFKRDLRLSDHAALELASRLPQKCLLLYILEPALLSNSHYRGRHWQFIAQSLRDLQQVLNASGRELAVLEGNAVALLNELDERLGIVNLLSYEETGLDVTFQRDLAVAKLCDAKGIVWRQFQTNGIERGRHNRTGWNKS